MADNIVVPQSPTSPGVIVTDDNNCGYYGRGLEGKDATFFLQNQVSDGFRNMTRDIVDNKAHAVEARLESQLQTVKTESILLAEIRENKYQQALSQAERAREVDALKNLILEKAKETTDMLKDMECARTKEQLAAMQQAASFAALKAEILAALPTPAV